MCKELMFKKIENPDEYYLDFESMFITISAECKKKFIQLSPCDEFSDSKPLTLKDISDKYGNGKDYGCITLYCESYTRGEILRYNNYRKKEWIRVGYMMGFA